MTSSSLVFVLMPFDDDFDGIFEGLLRPSLESVGYEVRRADSLFNQQQILKDVVKGIADAAIVIADVTGLNGNVLYELGLAHAMGKRTIMITQRLDELPFDLRPYRANEYSTRFDRADDLRQLLTKIGLAVADGSADFSNPIQDFAPHALGGQAQVAVAPQVASPILENPWRDAEREPDNEPGMWEYILAIEHNSEGVAEAVTRLGELTEGIGTSFKGHTERLARADARLGDRATAAKLTIARDAAKDLNDYAAALEPLIAQLQEALAEVAAGINSLARNAGIIDDDDFQKGSELLATLEQTESGLAEGRGGISSFAQTLLEIPHMDRTLTAACKRAAKLVNEAGEVIETAEAEFARARGLLHERLDGYQTGRRS